ncbi:hypothetical protein PLICRDRAFT_697092 [Plicaturopsis crispa FD-325 SS-3]|nr:hypothetical protein PLICRDRAFT_697092 [Plicaturopsis crispa FD-325 SS-3]
MGMHQMSTLPPELWDAVIHSVSVDDYQTLAACAAVCKEWLPASRSTLFQRDLCSGARRSCTLDSSSIEVLAALLESPACTIFPYISSLSIRMISSESFWLFLPKLTTLRSVRSLHFDQFSMRRPSVDARSAMQLIGESVRGLKLEFAAFEDMDHLVDFLASFPVLEELYLRRVRFSLDPGPVDQDFVALLAARHPLPLTLHTLRLPSGTSAILSVITSMVSSHEHMPHIRKLIAELRDYESALCTLEFMSSLAAVLEHLRVEAIYMPSSPDIIRHLDVSKNTNLRILELLFMTDGFDWNAQGHFLGTIIARVASSCMEEIRLAIPMEMLADDNLSALQPVNGALALAQFAHLRAVVIAVAFPRQVRDETYGKTMEKVKECFSHCQARGILWVEGVQRPVGDVH